MINRKEYLKNMIELFYMRRRTNILLDRIYDFSDKDFEEAREKVDEISDQLYRGEELLRVMSGYWIRSNEKDSTKEELEEDYSEYTVNYTRAYLTLDDAVSSVEDIVFNPDRIEGLTKKQVELLKKGYEDRIRYINKTKNKVDSLITKKSSEGYEIKEIITDFFDYEDEFNKSLKEYNSHYVEREKYDKMFLTMDSNMTRIIKRLKKEDKKNTLK